MRIEKCFTFFLIVLIITYLIFFLTAPTYRFGDDLRYLSLAKSIVTEKNPFLEKDLIAGYPVWYPPLVPYIFALFYLIFQNNFLLWVFFSRLTELLVFFISLFIFYKLTNYFKLSIKEKIVALGLFSFIPEMIYASVSLMQEIFMVFFTLLLFFLLFKKKPNYPLIALVSGLMFLTKQTAFFVFFGFILTIFVMKKERKEKILLLISALIGILVISGFWYYRNFVVFGNPLYYPSYERVVREESIFQLLYEEYLVIWGLLPAQRIIDKFPFLNSNLVNSLLFFGGVFFLPIIFIFVKNLFKYKKQFIYVLPPIFSLSVFLIYTPIFLGFMGVRYFLPSVPFLALIVSKGSNQKYLFFYFLIVFILFLIISAITQFTMIKKENDILSSLNFIFKKFPTKEIIMYKYDFHLRWVTNLFFGKDSQAIESISCTSSEKKGILNYCLENNKIIIFREGVFVIV
jgi:hypothetical protein